MSIEHITVNGHELTAFDLPTEPSEAYTVHVDWLGEVVVEKGKPPKEKDVPAMYMRKLVPALCEQNAELYRENAKLRELIANVHESLKADKAGMFHNLTLSAMEDDMRELGIEVK